MLIRYLKDVSICYDGIHVTHEHAGSIKDIKESLANIFISSGRAELLKLTKDESKKIKEYDNKAIKSYENKSVKRGRPKKAKK